jgi:hypothetical protein
MERNAFFSSPPKPGVMPSATDFYFLVTDARYEAPFVPHCILAPIPRYGDIQQARVRVLLTKSF